MKNRAVLIKHAEAWAQGELGVQRRVLESLKRQERAMRENDTPGLLEAIEGLQEELGQENLRGLRRRELFEALGRELGLHPTRLGLPAVLERLGPEEADGLGRLHAELKETLFSVRRYARRALSLARLHGDLLRELYARILGASEGGRVSNEGLFVNAEV